MGQQQYINSAPKAWRAAKRRALNLWGCGMCQRAWGLPLVSVDRMMDVTLRTSEDDLTRRHPHFQIFFYTKWYIIIYYFFYGLKLLVLSTLVANVKIYKSVISTVLKCTIPTWVISNMENLTAACFSVAYWNFSVSITDMWFVGMDLISWFTHH